MRAGRYALLDGIRGMAALFVVTRHTHSYWGASFFRSYLAVDLFFVLSGFVIAYAYEKRLQDGVIPVKEFILIRLIRLYPTYFLSFLASATVFFILSAAHGAFDGTSAGQENFNTAVISTLLTALMLPSRALGELELFPMNSVYWSLFFELIVNLIYASLQPKLTQRVLCAIVIIFGSSVAATALLRGNLNIGFYWGVDEIVAGFSRSMFGIFMGILLFRNIEAFVTKLGRYICPLLSAIFIAVILASPSSDRFNALVDALAVIIVLPLLVAMASQAQASKLDKLFIALGAASYPIYVLHVPLSRMVSFLSKGAEASIAPVGGILFVVALLIISLLVERLYDVPVRKWLTYRFVKRTSGSHRLAVRTDAVDAG